MTTKAELLDRVVELAKKNLSQDGYLQPYALFIKEVNGVAGFVAPPMPLNAPAPTLAESKTYSVLVAGCLARQVHADTVILIWDAAMRTVPVGTEIDPDTDAPLTYPKSMRTEVIVVQAINLPSGEETVKLTPYKGGNGEPVEYLSMDILKGVDKMESRFARIALKGYITNPANLFEEEVA